MTINRIADAARKSSTIDDNCDGVNSPLAAIAAIKTAQTSANICIRLLARGRQRSASSATLICEAVSLTFTVCMTVSTC